MATIITRETGGTAKGSPLTNAEMDANFININTELEGVVSVSTISSPGEIDITIGSATDTVNVVAGNSNLNIGLDDASNTITISPSLTPTLDYIDYTLHSDGDVTPEVGRSWYSDPEGVLNTTLRGGNVVLQHGLEILYTVTNQTGITIPNGTHVMAVGTLGNSGRILVAPAVTDGSIEPDFMMGLATEDIPNGGEGFVTFFGKVRGLNTSGQGGETWSDGDILWPNYLVDGALTNIEPSPPNISTPVAIVINAHASNGTLLIRSNPGFNLRQLHDVYATSPAEGQILYWNDTNSRYELTSTPKFGSIGGGNYFEVQSDGTVRLFGEATVWDDIQGSLIGRTLSSTAGAVDYDWGENAISMSSGGNISNQNDRVIWSIQYPHKAKEDGELRLHIHWEQVSTSQIEFTGQYRVQENGAVKNTSWTTFTANSTDDSAFTYPGSGTFNQITRLATIDMTGLNISSVIQFRLTRSDSTGGSVLTTFIDAHYEIDSLGSNQEYTK